MKRPANKTSFFIAVGLHVVLAILLFSSLERTIFIPAQSAGDAPPKPIIEATLVNKKSLQQEVKKRAQSKEQEKRLKELAIKEKVLKEKEVEEEHEAEQAKMLELKKTNEALKKEALQEKLTKEKDAKLLAAQLKEEKEELKKLEKEKQKEKELAAAKKKAEQALKKEEQNKALALKKQKENEKALEEALARENAEKAQKDSQENAQGERVKQDLISRYATLMRNKIHQHWRQPIGLDFSGFTCKIAVRLLPTGEVVDATVVESSGSVEFDRSTELAIRKASPLPMPEEAEVAKEFHHFTFTFHPEAA